MFLLKIRETFMVSVCVCMLLFLFLWCCLCSVQWLKTIHLHRQQVGNSDNYQLTVLVHDSWDNRWLKFFKWLRVLWNGCRFILSPFSRFIWQFHAGLIWQTHLICFFDSPIQFHSRGREDKTEPERISHWIIYFNWLKCGFLRKMSIFDVNHMDFEQK